MKTAFKSSFGILVALALVLVAAGAWFAIQHPVNPKEIMLALFAFTLLGGVPVVTYAYPIAGTTAPTAAQSGPFTTLTATVFLDTSDTTVTVTHNWGIVQTNQGYLFPTIILTPAALGATAPFVTATIPASSTTPANSVTLGKAATGAGTGCTFTVTLLRPHTILGGI